MLPLFIKLNTEDILAGYFNINLLKIHEKELFGHFFDSLTVNSFYAKIAFLHDI